MEKISAVLFDVDGTLLDTTEFILGATEYALKSCGFEVPTRAKITSVVGTPFPQFYFELSGSQEIDVANRLVEQHRNFQFKNYHLVKIFPGTKETLEALKEKGYKLAAVTTRSSKTSHQTLKDAGIDHLFEIVISFEDVKAHKPDPEPLLKALEYLQVVPEYATMVGDSDHDVEAGKNAGTKTIRAAYGFHRDRLHDPEPDYFINDITELLKIL